MTKSKDNKEPKIKTFIKSYKVSHKANPNKENSLFALYNVYKNEYKSHVINYWNLFKQNKIEVNDRGLIKFSHFGSTKHIRTPLNSAYLQICLAQASATLNNHLANISTKFSDIINHSSLNNKNIKDKDLLHQLRTINKNHSWLYNTYNKDSKNNYKKITYYPTVLITNDYGDLVEVKKETLISKEAIKLSRKIYNYITQKERVKFPSLDKPRLIIDDRLYSLEQSKSPYFDYWLKITTLQAGKRICIPIKSNDFFEKAYGVTGKTIELNFKFFDYPIIQHKHSSLNKNHNSVNRNSGKLTKVKRTIEFILNKKNEFNPSLVGTHLLSHTISFDLGLCNLIATSAGELYGKYWLSKLTEYDRRITDLFADRQYIFRKSKDKKNKIRSKRYDSLIKQVRGFIKTEINRILNQFFEKNTNIKTIIIEKLHFTRPELSKRLNRIIQNFGLTLFKDKLNELSLFKGFTIEELNPAYSSQECKNCSYVDINNRKTQSLYKCLCCKKELNADIQGSGVNLKRFQTKQNSTQKVIYNSLYKGIILSHLKVKFVSRIQSLVSNGYVCRREIYQLLLKNKYFMQDLKEINKILKLNLNKDKLISGHDINDKELVKTTEVSGVKPMTAVNLNKNINNKKIYKLNEYNFDSLLKNYYELL